MSRWGVGPAVDGLFVQANLGIVTRMTLWLAPAAQYYQRGLFVLDDSARLPALIDTLRRLKHAAPSELHDPFFSKPLDLLSKPGPGPRDVGGLRCVLCIRCSARFSRSLVSGHFASIPGTPCRSCDANVVTLPGVGGRGS